MRLFDFHRRSVTFFWRTNLAVMAGVAVGTAALTGALLVGDSMRGSLHDAAVGRLGLIDYAMVTPGYFQESLCDRISDSTEFGQSFNHVVPAISVQGSATQAETRARTNRVDVFGVDDRFWTLVDPAVGPAVNMPAGRSVLLNAGLADELAAEVGDTILLRIGKSGDVAIETLLGRRDDAGVTLRLEVSGIVPVDGLAGFALSPRQPIPLNAFVPLSVLQSALHRDGRINALLIRGRQAIADLQEILAAEYRLGDSGITLRVDNERGYVALESEAFLLAPPVESAARRAVSALNLQSTPVLTYLANSIERLGDDSRGIPYSTISAIGTGIGSAPEPEEGEIVLNGWAADDLQARPGDSVRVSYYMTGRFGQLETQTAEFRVAAVVPMAGDVADPGFTPSYPGITDSRSLADWDPPFPVDLNKVRDQDDIYWESYKAAPKAFINLQEGISLWADQPERFGSLTSLRIMPEADKGLEALAAGFEAELLAELRVEELGFGWQSIRADAEAASRGSTDFGGLFMGFSLFLIVSAAMLVALLFRLAVEHRVSEVGILLATGFEPKLVRHMLVSEGVILAGLGSLAGLALAIAYAWLMLAGLRSWWSEAVHAPFLTLHTTPLSFGIGYVAGVGVAVLSIAWSIRGLTSLSPRLLIAGRATQEGSLAPRPGSIRSKWVAACGFAISLALMAATAKSGAAARAGGFFGGGACALVGCLALFRAWLNQGGQSGAIVRTGVSAWGRLGMRNAPRNIGRSMLTTSLIASATFVIAALQAFRIEAVDSAADKSSGSGGFSLYAESSVPLAFDMNTAAGRDSLNMNSEASGSLEAAEIFPFRLQGGDETSCVNLYLKKQPRLLGATEVMVQRGGFVFGATMAESDEERANPWLLLRRRFDDGAYPVVGDEAAVLWQLHSGLGKDITVKDDRGNDVVLRFVALLKGSLFQGELVMSEANLLQLHPATQGYGFFLVEVPADQEKLVGQLLERSLADFGFDVGRTSERIAAYSAVQNTYLSTFQTLGGLGLVLGTVGLAVVLLRNVWERRSELALMRALGFSSIALGWVVMAENVLLVSVGLACGLIPALLAISPHIVSTPSGIAWMSMGGMLLSVLVTGVVAGLLALLATFRAPLLPALRCE